jgi:hypothetical protein
MVRCHGATASSLVAKVWGEVFAHFHTVVCRIDCLSYQNEFFVMMTMMMIMLLTLLFTCLAIIGLSECGPFCWEDCCFVSAS